MARSEVIWLSKLEHLRITFAAPLGFNTGSDLKILCHGGASTGQRQTGCRCGRYGEFVQSKSMRPSDSTQMLTDVFVSGFGMFWATSFEQASIHITHGVPGHLLPGGAVPSR